MQHFPEVIISKFI
ncbi:unnamed protein product [Staurois parvus]|uniref:Uncharacterized protein n=1 Tax=Staurois parvus TaxID=386267 RepID=A0ABN9DDB1_9NEOB|nr:unnamed protein product [Staurois parvus]